MRTSLGELLRGYHVLCLHDSVAVGGEAEHDELGELGTLVGPTLLDASSRVHLRAGCAEISGGVRRGPACALAELVRADEGALPLAAGVTGCGACLRVPHDQLVDQDHVHHHVLEAASWALSSHQRLEGCRVSGEEPVLVLVERACALQDERARAFGPEVLDPRRLWARGWVAADAISRVQEEETSTHLRLPGVQERLWQELCEEACAHPGDPGASACLLVLLGLESSAQGALAQLQRMRWSERRSAGVRVETVQRWLRASCVVSSVHERVLVLPRVVAEQAVSLLGEELCEIVETGWARERGAVEVEALEVAAALWIGGGARLEECLVAGRDCVRVAEESPREVSRAGAGAPCAHA